MADKIVRSIKVKCNLDFNKITTSNKIVGEKSFYELTKNTHEIYHEGVFYYQKMLLLMRQDEYWLEQSDNPTVTQEQCKEELWELCIKALERNTLIAKEKKIKLEDIDINNKKEEILKIIKDSFNTIAPLEGKMEEPKDYLNQLCFFDKKPPGVATSGRPNTYYTRFLKFINQYNLNNRWEISGVKPDKSEMDRVYIKILQELNEYSEDLKKDFQIVIDAKKEVESDLNDTLEKYENGEGKLRKWGIFPLFPKYFQSERFSLLEFSDIRSTWDYSIWSLAVSSIRAWNTQTRKCSIEYLEIYNKLNEKSTSISLSEYEKGLLMQYESNRFNELSEISEESSSPFRINSRMIRGLELVLESWKNADSNELKIKYLNKLQTEKSKQLGDVHFYQWLAKDDNKTFLENDGKKIKEYVVLNNFHTKLDMRKKYAICTLADSYFHPRWINLEKDGKNQPGYDLFLIGSDRYIEIPFLDLNNNMLNERKVRIPIVDSDQFYKIDFIPDQSKKKSIDFQIQLKGIKTLLSCEPGGAKIQFNRKSLEKYKSNQESKDFKKAFNRMYFNISWKIDSLITDKNIYKYFYKNQDLALLSWSAGEKEKTEISKRENTGSKSTLSFSNFSFSKENELRGMSGLKNISHPRLMFVDMGIRSFASCSIFRIDNIEPNEINQSNQSKLYFKMKSYPFKDKTGRNLLNDPELYSVHERSFVLRMNGESNLREGINSNFLNLKNCNIKNFEIPHPSNLGALREFIISNRKSMRQKVNAMRLFRKIGNIGNREEHVSDEIVQNRKNIINDFIQRYNKAEYGWPFGISSDSILQRLTHFYDRGLTQSGESLWKKEIEEIIQKEIEPTISKQFQKWRENSKKIGQCWAKSNKKTPLYGLSYFGIEEISETKKLLLSWNTRVSEGGKGKAKFLDKGSKFAVKLSEHLTNKKRDRLKKGVNALINLALGYEWVQFENNKPIDINNEPIELDENNVPISLLKTGKIPKFKRKGYGEVINGGWVALYPPCVGIIFEDLSRYLTKLDRPKSENSQLMKWTHRAIPSQVLLQSEIFNLKVGEVGAAYSSKFHARTGSPGIRGNVHTKEFLERIKNQIQEAENAFEKSKNQNNSDSKLTWKDYANEYPIVKYKKIFTSLNVVNSLLEKLSVEKYGILLPEAGGEYFITLNNDNKAIYLNADINAAQNLAKRFLTRYSNPEKINFQYNKTENVFLAESSPTKNKRIFRQMGFLKGNILENNEDIEKSLKDKMIRIKLEDISEEEFIKFNPKYQQKEKVDEVDLDVDSDHEIEMELGGIYSFFCDHSGNLLDNRIWYSSKWFWSVVQNKIYKELLDNPILIKIS